MDAQSSFIQIKIQRFRDVVIHGSPSGVEVDGHLAVELAGERGVGTRVTIS